MAKNKEVKRGKFNHIRLQNGMTVSIEHDELYDGPRQKIYEPRDKSFLNDKD